MILKKIDGKNVEIKREQIADMTMCYGQAFHSFTNIGTTTKNIDISSFGLSEIYSVQITKQLTYVDNQYMKDSDMYLHSYSTTQLKVNIVNGYPATIGYYINYLVIGKKQ